MGQYYLGGDPAKQNDYFGIVILEVIDDKIKLIALKELKMDYTIVANYIKNLHKKYNFRKIFMDKTGIGTVFIDMLKDMRVEGITLSNPKKVEIIETVIRLMQEGRLKLPKHGADELKIQLQEQEKGLTESGMIKFKHAGKHDDLFWAYAIGCYGVKESIDGGISYMVTASKKYHYNREIEDDFGSGIPEKLRNWQSVGYEVYYP